MNDYTVQVITWICATIMVCSAMAGITYYNVLKPSETEVMERMVREQGIHPMVFRCMRMDMSRVGNFEVCNTVMKNLKLTPDQEDRFREHLDSAGPQR